MNIDMVQVRERARNELHSETFRTEVEREKQRLRECKNLSLWQRLTNWLPFTINIERKKT